MVPARASHKSGPDLCEAAAPPHTNMDQICVRWRLCFDRISIAFQLIFNRFSVDFRRLGGWSRPGPHTNLVLVQICVRQRRHLTQIWTRFV